MNEFFIHYSGTNIFCSIIFGILLFHGLINMDRQEKQIKYDMTLVSFILYFITDCFWAALTAGYIPLTRFSIVCIDFFIYIFMTMISYTWLNYVMALEQTPDRNKPIKIFAILFPFLISTILLIGTYIFAPQVLVNEQLELQPIYNFFLVTVPYIYIAAVMVYAFRKARHEDNPIEKRKHIFVGFFPLIVVIGGLVQMLLFPNHPVYCCCCTVLMLIFFIQMQQKQISIDPLTGLNNRGQLLRYVSQNSNIHRDDSLTYVMMIDINDFKEINDDYGHAMGDEALILLAEVLKNTVTRHNFPVFLGRYGGDEFIIIAHPQKEEELSLLISDIRKEVTESCKEKNTPYSLTVGIGCDQLLKEPDTFQKCLQRADKKLYLDKEYVKLQNRS